MTALQPSFTPSFFGHGPFDTMPDQTPGQQDWQHHNHHHHQQNQQHNNNNDYIPHMPMLTGQWAPQPQTPSNTQPQQQQQQQQQMLGMPGGRFYPDNDSAAYMSYTSTTTSNNLISPGFPPENTWSDMDIGTPSNNFDSPNDPLDSYPQAQPTQSRLQPPPRVPSVSKHHPHAHAPSLSPHQEAPDPMSVDRPSMPGRSQTAPVKTPSATKSSKTPTIKPLASDEAESDDDFVPSESNLTTSKHQPQTANNQTSNRGRKRQRIPHTAVERRYRENLNAHLERLRQTVPSLATRRSSSGIIPLTSNVSTNQTNNSLTAHRASDPTALTSSTPVATLLADGAKPSKCEILNGAIEHIGAVERENLALREEVKELRARVEDLQRWYSATLRSAGGGQGGGFAG